MSLSSKKSPLAVRAAVSFSLKEALFEDGYEYVGKYLYEIPAEQNYYRDSYLTPREIADIQSGAYVEREEDLKEILAYKSSGARYIGWRLFRDNAKTIKELCSDWAATKAIVRALKKYDPKEIVELQLASLIHEENDVYYKYHPQPLLVLGIRWEWQVHNFIALYKELRVKNRVWNSSKQVNQAGIAQIACVKNYNKLPLWVKKILWQANNVPQERVGNIWRLIHCAKAWKHAPNLPKTLAEKIGKLDVKYRILADLAWQFSIYGVVTAETLGSGSYYELNDITGEWHKILYNRSAKIESFWQQFRRLCNLPLFTVLEEAWQNGYQYNQGNYNKLRVLTEETFGLPYKFLWDIWSSKRNNENINEITEKTLPYVDPIDACLNLFGVKGKRTLELFKSCKEDSRKWASKLAFGDVDLVQKYLALEYCVAYCDEAVDFLKALHPSQALRMIATTTFKIRGETKSVEEYHVKDTGYLWRNIQNKPELGRIRCWLSVHEELARSYIKEQPDEPLYLNPQWLPLNNLEAIDRSWSIEIPSNSCLLKLWGEQLKHCVGAYNVKVNKKECVILGIKVDGYIKYTIEMTPNYNAKWYCNQFYGYRNSRAPYELQNQILAVFKDAKLM